MGAVTLVSFLAVFLIHKPVVNRFVVTAPSPLRPRRQFFAEYALVLAAGIGVMIHNRVVHAIPFLFTLKFFVGYVATGFFIALDMALARERTGIAEALAREDALPPPAKLYPLTRRFFLVALGTAVLLVAVLGLVIARDMVWLARIAEDGISAQQALAAVLYEMVFIMLVLLIMVTNLVRSYSRNLKMLFETETGILAQVSRGDLSKLVPVATYDEFGVIAGYTNTMIEGLRHRIRLISALKMAEEVQRKLLPRHPPKRPGLDVAGASRYCDEVGGDYYDFLDLPDAWLGVVVADASGHGVGSALHMAAARAFLRSGARQYAGPERLLGAVNRFLTEDGADTGRFTALFFLEIDPARRRLVWVRAGHEPALLYDPVADIFEFLGGDGLALGVDADYPFMAYRRHDWTSGSVVVIGTDGIRETRDPDGEMFGNDRLKTLIRRHAAGPAETTMARIFDAVREFRGAADQEDDLTLVVIRLS